MINIETYDINDSSCKNYSIEFSNLIEFIKKIRTLTKTAKYHVIKLLNKKAHKLEHKQKAKGQDQSNKLTHKQAEVEFLEKADLDSLSKRIFANKYETRDLEQLGDKLSLEDRVIIRLFSFHQLNKEITEFRAKHNDWEELVDVLLYRNTCGKMKINKTKTKKQQISIPLPYGVNESEIKHEETKEVYSTPATENQKITKEKKQNPKKNNEKKEKENEENKKEKKDKKKEKEDKKKEGKNSEKAPEEIVEKFEISDEKLEEFVKNQDDLDEWEKDLDENEDEMEFNLMAPLNPTKGKPKQKDQKKEGKNSNKSKPAKRKAPHHKDGNPKQWKKPSQS